MSFWSALWGAPDLVNKATDAAIATGDKLFFTEEERADYRKSFANWYLKFLEVSSGSDLARRLLAVIMTTLFSLQIIGTSALYTIGALTSEVVTIDGAQTLSINVWTLAADKNLALLSDITLPLEMMIIGFYFTVRAITNFVNSKK